MQHDVIIEKMLLKIPGWQLVGQKKTYIQTLSRILIPGEMITALQEAFFDVTTSENGVLFITDERVIFVFSNNRKSPIVFTRGSLQWSSVANYASCVLTLSDGKNTSSFTITGSEATVKAFAEAATNGKPPSSLHVNTSGFTWNSLNDSIASLFDTLSGMGSAPIIPPENPLHKDNSRSLDFLFIEAKKIHSLILDALSTPVDSNFIDIVAQDVILLASLAVYADGMISDEEKVFLGMVMMPLKSGTDPQVQTIAQELFKATSLPKKFYSHLESYWSFLASFIKASDIELQKNKLASLTTIHGTDDDDSILRHDRLATAYMLFVNCIMKADGTITEEEETRLTQIIALIQRSNFDPNFIVKTAQEDDETLESVMAKINALVGMKNIKDQINTFINLIKVQKEREQRKLPVSPMSLHAVFYGPPGTGKTTIARLLGKVYKCLGLLKQGHLTETDRSGVVAGYVGQTAIKTDEIVQKSLDGVLFIDEAYSLASADSSNDFGQEAIDTLLKRMEDFRERFVVIVAGYTDEMQLFINANPGLKSRFSKYFYFDHYEPSDLLKIFEIFVKNASFILDEDAKGNALTLFTAAYELRDRSFGNGRFVRNTFEKAIEKQANRIAGIAPLTHTILCTLTAHDIPSLHDMST